MPFAGRTIIIGVHAGGLGDHLAYSVLPRLYKQAGAARVLLSLRTTSGEPFVRNPDMSELVWKRNSFVDGFTDEPPNVGETSWPPVAFFRAAKTSSCPTDAVAKVHGFPAVATDGRTRLFPARPDLFYTPRFRQDVAGRVVCDPRSVSQPFSPDVFARFVAFIGTWFGFAPNGVVVLDSADAGVHGRLTLADNPRHAVGSIFEYADIVHSAGCFLVTEAGGQSLAAGVRSANTHVLISSRAFNQKHFMWPAHSYWVTSETTAGEREWP